MTPIVFPGIIFAFCRLHREERITGMQYRQLKSLLMANIEDAPLCVLAPAILAQAAFFLENNVTE